MKICILGAGSYGTALAYVFAYTGVDVIIFARDQNQINMINNYHINPKRFSRKRLPNNITATNNLSDAVITPTDI